MSRTVATILTLQDRMSGGILRASRNVQGMSREMRQATNQTAKMATGFTNGISKMASKVVKFGAIGAATIAGIGAKAGFGEAFDMEGYKVQLETATKDTVKAGKLMSDAVKFANKTPFETGEVVQATAKMEMYGLSSKRWLSDVADMAGSTNKTIDQATEAMADVAVGEFERIKEFGIKKDMILAASNKKYGEGVVINAKGQVIDQKKLMDITQEMMQQKFKGGAEKLAGTTKGLWSTITGVTKSSLAKIAGMQEDGTIKSGSLMDKAKTKIKEIADQIQKMQANGTIDKIAKNVTEVFSNIYKAISKTMGFLIKHKETIVNFGIAFGSLVIGIKVAKGLRTAMLLVKSAIVLTNGALAVTPFGWVVIGVTLLVGGFILLYKNSAKFREGVATLIVKLKEFGSAAKDKIGIVLSKISEIIQTKVIPAFKTIGTWIQANIIPVFVKLGGFIQTNVIPVFMKIAGIIAGMLVQAFNTIIPLIKGFYTNVIAPLATFLATVIPPIFAVIVTAVMFLWQNVLLPLALFLVNVFQAAFQVVLPIIGSIFSNIFETIGGVIDAATSIFSGLVDFITGVFTGNWSQAWEGIVSIFSGIFDGIKAVASGVINSVINGINLVIRSANKISSIGGIFGDGLNISEIPKFAKGTNYAPGGLSLVGEKGPEFVNLKKGDTVTTADKTSKILNSKGDIKVYVTIQGNVIGNEEYADYVGNTIVGKVKLALTNI